MSSTFLKIKSKLTFDNHEVKKTDIHLELDELNMNILPVLQERQ